MRRHRTDDCRADSGVASVLTQLDPFGQGMCVFCSAEQSCPYRPVLAAFDKRKGMPFRTDFDCQANHAGYSLHFSNHDDILVKMTSDYHENGERKCPHGGFCSRCLFAIVGSGHIMAITPPDASPSFPPMSE